MKRILIIICLVLFGGVLKSQDFTEEQQEVYDVIIKLFDGMREGDSTKVRSVFFESNHLFTATTNKNGDPILHSDDLQQFLNAVGTPHDIVRDERIWDTEIRIDARLAQVWTKYVFYAGDNFSHCGVNAFELFKTNDGWKIFFLTDTRQREGCEIPLEIQK